MIALLFALVGCSDDATKEAENPCGDGDQIQRNDETYCYYGSALIIEGFDCPPDFAHRFDRPNGAVLCSTDPNLMDDELDDIIEFWELRENSQINNANNLNNFNNANNINNINNTNNIDENNVTVLSNDDGGSCPAGVANGDSIVVIDWECQIKQCCGGGTVMAACGDMGGDYLCRQNLQGWFDCFWWDEADAGACPFVEGGDYELCAAPLGDDACEDGKYCKDGEDFPLMFPDDVRSPQGYCLDRPQLCTGTCYEDSDCDVVGSAIGCYGADPHSGEAGACRERPGAVGDCRGIEDCPFGWECAGESLSCADDLCACVDPIHTDTAGTCQLTNGGSTPGLWLRNSEGLTWNSSLEVYWAKPGVSGADHAVGCPAYEVQVYDPMVGYVTVAEEPCPNGVDPLRRLQPGQILPLESVNLGITNRVDPGLIRLRGEYLTQCTGATPATCTGPFERFSPAQYEVR